MGDLYTFLGLSDSEGSGDEEQAPVRQTKKQRKQEAEEPQQDKKKKSKGKDAAAKEDKADARTSREEAAKKIADRKALLNARTCALVPFVLCLLMRCCCRAGCPQACADRLCG